MAGAQKLALVINPLDDATEVRTNRAQRDKVSRTWLQNYRWPSLKVKKMRTAEFDLIFADPDPRPFAALFTRGQKAENRPGKKTAQNHYHPAEENPKKSSARLIAFRYFTHPAASNG
jgi:hypothetical protein